MDVLSEVLRAVRLEGALFFNGEFSAPWCLSTKPASIAPYLSPHNGQLIIYHFVTEGRAYAQLDVKSVPERDNARVLNSVPVRDNARVLKSVPVRGSARVGMESVPVRGSARVGGRREELSAGEVVVFAHGDPHFLGNGTAEPVDSMKTFGRNLSEGLKLARFGGGGEVTRFVCGFMVCEPRLGQVFLAGLPRMFKVRVVSDASDKWLEHSIRFSVGEGSGSTSNGASSSNSASTSNAVSTSNGASCSTGARVSNRSSSAGSELIRAKLAELLFVETLRRYINQLPVDATGWLAGVRDASVGHALALLHSDPSRAWTIADLARQVGTSRSRLAERFRHFLGESPMAYLAQWRLRLGAEILQTTDDSVAQVAAAVGYGSEAAFNRAFKREFLSPPAAFRHSHENNGVRARG